MMTPRLSVILPSYNSERYIGQAIDSVIAQSFNDWELMIIDGASSDSTHAISTNYQRRDSRIRLIIPIVDHGVAYARNVGLDRARGQYIAFIDSDDIWYPTKAAMQVHALEQAQADISFTAYWRVSVRTRHRRFVAVPEHVAYREMLRRDLIGTSTAMVRRVTCGSFRMPNLQTAEDHAYWLSLLRDGTRSTIGINQPLAEYRVRSDSLSANKLMSARNAWKLRRHVERLGILRSIWSFSGYAYDAVRLRLLTKKSARNDRNLRH